MPNWYEVFDDEQVQLKTRRGVRRVLIGMVVALSILALSGPFLVVSLPNGGLVMAGLALLALGVLGVASSRLVRLQRVMWCVKLSVHRLVGFDYARRRIQLPWCEIERVEVDGEGILVVGLPGAAGAGPVLRIPEQFPDYHALSHRVVEYAEAHGVPICIEGRPWQLLDVATLFPFLHKQAAEAPRGGGTYWRG